MELLLDDCEVVGINRFSLASEPVLTIAERHLWVNMACINILPDAVRVLFLLDRQAHKLTLKPASEEIQGTIRWKTPNGKPRKLLCEEFLQDVAAIMAWNADCRRKLPGVIAQDCDGAIITFELAQSEVLTLAQHRQNPLIKRLEEDVYVG